MGRKEVSPLVVYYDGLCRLCSREIDHYRKQEGASGIRFLDITSHSFDAGKEKVDPVAVHKVMHVRLPNGTLATGLDAFLAIWDFLPRYRFLGRLARKQPAQGFLRFGYRIFARIRPYLPRKKADCEESPYCDL